jgi:ribose 5-phosphate isomerase B
MIIALGSDHAGFIRKGEIADFLRSAGHHIIDVGTFTADSVDYPDSAAAAARLVAGGTADFGVLCCGSGIGVSITANKIQGIRAANCVNEEMAELSRKHNNANVLTIGERLVDKYLAIRITQVFLMAQFEGGRHERRVEKIHSLTGC